MKTASTNKKIREIISMVRDGTLVPRPEFQRRLVWTRENKNHFIDSILRKFPFPEIYLANGSVDVNTGQGTQLLVDGLQRVNTIIQYFNDDPELKLTNVPSYRRLSEEDKIEFLQYDIAVRDLGQIDRDTIIETFKRLNATKYSLSDIEINNAVYSGAMKRYAETLASSEFFTSRRVFTSLDYKRMGDLRFALQVIITMIEGYFNRDDSFEELLERYNDEFDLEGEISSRINGVIGFIDDCNFQDRERIWRKSDLFSIIVELDRIINIERMSLQPLDCYERVTSFYSKLRRSSSGGGRVPGIYHKAAVHASTDKISRVRRGVIIYGILLGKSDDEILAELLSKGFIREVEDEVQASLSFDDPDASEP